MNPSVMAQRQTKKGKHICLIVLVKSEIVRENSTLERIEKHMRANTAFTFVAGIFSGLLHSSHVETFLN